jgi:transglutaminase-like putative cysteine protease
LDSSIEQFVKEIQKYTNNDITTFMSMLCGEINLNWQHQYSYMQQLMTPNDCFKSKAGSCRDLSWMMIQMFRCANIPARFVSGYAYNVELETDNELHAWVEAWIPGAGWIGLDPSSGLIATEHYIPVATSYHPKNTLPVQGTFRGNAQSKLTTQVNITSLD